MIPDPTILVIAESGGYSNSQWLIIIAMIVVITLLLLRSQRRRTQGASPKQYRREIDSATNQSAAIKRDMERLLVELNELARQINAQIDTKFAKLERSIIDADRRITALRILINEAGGDAQSSDPISPPPQVPENRFDSLLPPDSSESPISLSSAAAPTAPLDWTVDDSGISDSATDEDAAHHQIYTMADQGHKPVEIARALQQSVGEVELILKLRQRGGV